MPLDPEVKPFIEPVNALEGFDYDTLDLPFFRAQMKAFAEAEPVRTPVGSVTDRTVPGTACDVPVRIYRPEGAAPFGVLVFFHGGGWCVGDVASHDGLCRDLAAAAEVVVVSVDYRLAPEHPFPAAVEDAVAVTAWVAEHAAELDTRPDHLAVGGDSAGGNLAAVVTHLARDEGGPSIRFQLLLYPCTDLRADHPSYEENGRGYGAPAEFVRWLIARYAGGSDNVLDPRASPVLATRFDGLPPALVVTAEYDPLRDDGLAYAERLRAANVPVALRFSEGMPHGFMQWPIEGTRRAVADVAAALRQALA